MAEGTGKETPDEVTAECITATRVRFLPERNVQQNGAVTRNLVGSDVFWVDVETMGPTAARFPCPMTSRRIPEKALWVKMHN